MKTVPVGIASALLVLFLLASGTALGLGAFIYYRHQETATELARLGTALSQAKSRQQLQAEIMQGANRWGLFPHIDKRVGFVLNSGIPNSTLYAADGDSYPVNAIGLRGNAIEPKAPGVTRIALVSDSWFFGWRLRDGERLQAQLTALLQRHYPGKKYEVVTVAVPGWNVENQAAFLEDYFDRLQSDVLVWSINANDLWDTQGVVPPGVPATRPSPGSTWLCPDMGFAWSMLPMPIVIERWRRNVALMNEVSATYKVPILALHVDDTEPYVSMIRQVGQPTFPIVSTPAKFLEDPRWQIDPGVDSHPTPWATQILAIDLFGHLIEYGHLPPTELPESERAVIEMGKAASRGVSAEAVQAFVNSAHGVPANYGGAARTAAISADGKTCPEGRIPLGRAEGANMAEISFEQVRNNARLTCSAKTKDGGYFQGTTDGAVCRVSIPPSPAAEIVDLYWKFDKFSCDDASDCFSANFKSARIY